jgi:ubiquinone biosynthesis accessory factor UbiJ
MLLDPLESVLNRNIAASATARRLCGQLDGKVLSIHVIGTPINLHLSPGAQRIAVTLSHEGASDASIYGSPLGLLALIGKRPESTLRAGSVRIEGDAEIAQAFRDLLTAAAPDVEEEISRVVGDVAAHGLGTFAREVAGFGRRAASTFARNVTEYLQEESRDLPTRIEVDEFVTAVDVLRDDVERAAARIDRLEQGTATRS